MSEKRPQIMLIPVAYSKLTTRQLVEELAQLRKACLYLRDECDLAASKRDSESFAWAWFELNQAAADFNEVDTLIRSKFVF